MNTKKELTDKINDLLVRTWQYCDEHMSQYAIRGMKENILEISKLVIELENMEEV